MTSQPQGIAKNILLNISRIKGNQTIEFGQLIEYLNHAENEAGKLVPDHFLFF